jgi:hypothetical protein
LGSDASGEGEGGGEEGRERVAATHPDTRVTQAAAKLGPTWVRCTCGKKKSSDPMIWPGFLRSIGMDHRIPTVGIGLRICDCCNRVDTANTINLFVTKNRLDFRGCYDSIKFATSRPVAHLRMYVFFPFFTQHYINAPMYLAHEDDVVL